MYAEPSCWGVLRVGKWMPRGGACWKERQVKRMILASPCKLDVDERVGSKSRMSSACARKFMPNWRS